LLCRPQEARCLTVFREKTDVSEEPDGATVEVLELAFEDHDVRPSIKEPAGGRLAPKSSSDSGSIKVRLVVMLSTGIVRDNSSSLDSFQMSLDGLT
jgi:hypothetical protein